MASSRRRALLAGGLALLALAACRESPRQAALPAGSRVLALGDSLTYGTGASGAAAWPTRLAQGTGWDVINAGVPGDTSAAALQRLPGLLAKHAPQLVIVSIGGNDFLRAVPAAQTEANLAAILAAARAAGAQTLLVGVPRPTALGAALGKLADHPLYAQLAAREPTPLLTNAWAEVLSDPALKSDPIHANDAGYARFAERLHERLSQLGWLR